MRHLAPACLALLALGLTLVPPARAESLAQAWEASLAADHGLRAAGEQAAAAGEQLAAARNARRPGFGVEASATALSHEPAVKAGLFGESIETPVAQGHSYRYAALVTLPVYTSGLLSQGIAAATAAHEAASLAVDAGRADLKLRVAEAYVDVQRAEHAVGVAQTQLRSLEALSEDVGQLHGQGMVSLGDVLAVGAALAEAQQQNLLANNALALAEAAYNRQLGRPLEQAVALDPLPTQEAAAPLEDLLRQAASQRVELLILTQQIEAQEHRAQAQRGASGPQLQLVGGYVYEDNRYQSYPGQWMVTLGGRWSLFDGGVAGRTAAATQRQSAALAEQREDLASLIALQVRQAWLDLDAARRRIAVAESGVAQAEQNRQVAGDRYREGLGTQTEVLAAETRRAASQASLGTARLDAALAALRLRHAAGGL